MKKKIAMILHGLSDNGIDTMLANLSDCWDLEAFEIYYFLAVDRGAKQIGEEKVLKNGCHVIHLHDLDRLRLLKWPFTLQRALKRYGPFDAAHSHVNFLSGLNLWVAKRAGIPVRIAHAHTTSDAAPSALKNIFSACMKRLLAADATHRLACSEEAGEELFGKAHFEVIPNGIDVQRFLSDTSTAESRQETVFIAVGRFSPEKNPEFILRIFDEILRRLSGARLLWAGEGKLLEMTKCRAGELGIAGAVDFLGFRRDIPEIMKRGDCFLFPSLYEGFGNALIEAQAAGLDCFASDTVPKTADCGKVCFLSLDLPAAEWAERIVAHIRSGKKMKLDRERLAEYDIHEMANRLMRIYDGGEKKTGGYA